jgi:16S rRNA (uracil1498-N3)-methyltransferase
MPGSIRLFVRTQLSAGVAVEASPSQAHYLGTVMRRRVGDQVRLFNGADGEWQTRIGELQRSRAVLEVECRLRGQEPGIDLWLVFAPLKRDLTELVVQKATELGVSALLPVITERSNAHRLNLDRLSAIATEAAEQSERLTVPVLQSPQRLPALLDAWLPERRLFAAAERASAPYPPSLYTNPASQSEPAALLVGPEGGFAPAELEDLRSRAFVVAVTLGPYILRAETAAIAGLVLLQAPVPR